MVPPVFQRARSTYQQNDKVKGTVSGDFFPGDRALAQILSGLDGLLFKIIHSIICPVSNQDSQKIIGFHAGVHNAEFNSAP